MYFSDLSEPPPRRNESQKDDNRPNLDILTKAKDYFVEKVIMPQSPKLPDFCVLGATFTVHLFIM